ncbi:MAG: Spy/CpxP family protein refolding chaperone [Pyrinomonadaceae bacterium]
MKNRILVLAGVAVLVIAATVFAVAQGPGFPHGGGGGGGDMVEHMSRALNLTDAQKTQVKAIMDAERAATEPGRSRMEDVHKQLQATTLNGQFDEAQVRGLAAQASQIMTDQMVEHVRAFTKIFALLTPEQRVKAQEMHKAMGPGGHGPGGPMGHRPPGQ